MRQTTDNGWADWLAQMMETLRVSHGPSCFSPLRGEAVPARPLCLLKLKPTSRRSVCSQSEKNYNDESKEGGSTNRKLGNQRKKKSRTSAKDMGIGHAFPLLPSVAQPPLLCLLLHHKVNRISNSSSQISTSKAWFGVYKYLTNNNVSPGSPVPGSQFLNYRLNHDENPSR